MRRCLLSLLLPSVLAACAGGAGPPASIKVYKPRGSVQCADRGAPPGAMGRELTNAGISVLSLACGNDGRIRPQLCGMPDGAINIFEIPASEINGALALSFLLLSTLPGATEAPCK